MSSSRHPLADGTPVRFTYKGAAEHVREDRYFSYYYDPKNVNVIDAIEFPPRQNRNGRWEYGVALTQHPGSVILVTEDQIEAIADEDHYTIHATETIRDSLEDDWDDWADDPEFWAENDNPDVARQFPFDPLKRERGILFDRRVYDPQ